MPETGNHSVAVALLAHLRRARDHIDRNYCEPLDLDRLARVAGVSKYHFARSFEATYGETPIRYLTRRHIERAQDLLRVRAGPVGRRLPQDLYRTLRQGCDLPAGTS